MFSFFPTARGVAAQSEDIFVCQKMAATITVSSPTESSKKRQREEIKKQEQGEDEETSDSETDDDELKQPFGKFGSRFKKRYQLSKGNANYPWVVVPLPDCTTICMAPNMRRYKFELIADPEHKRAGKISFTLMTVEENEFFEDAANPEERTKGYSWENYVNFNTLDLNKGMMTIHNRDSTTAMEPLIWSLHFYNKDKRDCRLHNGLVVFEESTPDKVAGRINENVRELDDGRTYDQLASVESVKCLAHKSRPFICVADVRICYPHA